MYAWLFSWKLETYIIVVYQPGFWFTWIPFFLADFYVCFTWYNGKSSWKLTILGIPFNFFQPLNKQIQVEITTPLNHLNGSQSRLLIEYVFHKDYCFSKGLESRIPGDYYFHGL